MDNFAVYPGTFSPPTCGHLNIAERAAAVFGRITVVCSENPDKENLFSKEECKKLWGYYKPLKNIEIRTLREIKELKIPPKNLIMIRGLRNTDDYEYEKKIVFQNKKNFGIDKYFFLVSGGKYCSISSSRVRRKIGETRLADLSKMISPLVISEMLEKKYNLKRLFLAAGRPASGKSLILGRIARSEKNFIHINTDEIGEDLKPLIRKNFPDGSLAALVDKNEEDIKKIIKTPWLDALSNRLASCPANSYVVVEVPYALKPGMDTYRYLGGRIIYFGCGEKQNYQRNRERGSLDIEPFIKKIPGLKDSRRIAEREKLSLLEISTSFPLSRIEQMTKKIANKIMEA